MSRKETIMGVLTLDVGLAYKLKQALLRNNIPDVADLDWLATGDNLIKIRQMRIGDEAIKLLEQIIDLNTTPFVPHGWSVVEHRKSGQFRWSANNIALHLSNYQQDGVVGHELRKELSHLSVANANVLDFLLSHPHLIPEEWKDGPIFFWGTIYLAGNGLLYVRLLEKIGGRWRWETLQLDNYWRSNFFAAVLI